MPYPQETPRKKPEQSRFVSFYATYTKNTPKVCATTRMQGAGTNSASAAKTASTKVQAKGVDGKVATQSTKDGTKKETQASRQ